MPQGRPQGEITPLMHRLMHAQRVSARKAEQAERRERARRDFERSQDAAILAKYGVARDDPHFRLVQKAVFKAVDNGLDFHNARACRKIADKVIADIERKQRREETDVVYYLRQGDHIKIGTTKDINRRLREYPPGTELLVTETGSYLRERERLEQFRDDLRHGNEWFAPSPALMDHINALRGAAAA